MSKTVFITREIPEVAIRMLKEKGYAVDMNAKNSPLTEDELISHIKEKEYDAVVTLLTDKINSNIFENAPTVKLYANYATGFDNIDINEARKRGITVTNAPADLSSDAVAEHTIALMFALIRRIVPADSFVRRGEYTGWAPMNFIGTDILGKTFGLVGVGRIGERVAHYAKALGMEICYTDVIRNADFEKKYNAAYHNSIEELLPHADVVSLHVPLLDSTKHLINAERLALLKPTSFLINTSRGPVIDEKTLELFLREKKIAGAALDVFEFEPQITSGLLELDNVILTPHIASSSMAARNQMAETVASNIIDFFENKTPKNIVNA